VLTFFLFFWQALDGLGVRLVIIQRAAGEKLGISVTKEAGIEGIVIAGVSEGGAAAKNGQIAAGDCIVEIDGEDVRETEANETKVMLRAIGDVAHFVLQEKKESAVVDGGADGDYDTATTLQTKLSQEQFSVQYELNDDEEESGYAIRLVPGTMAAAKKAAPPPPVKSRSKSVKVASGSANTAGGRGGGGGGGVGKKSLSVPSSSADRNPFDDLVDEEGEVDDMLAGCNEYHGAMNREQAAALLAEYGVDGSWLIRMSRGKYVLTVNWHGVVRHLLMDVTESSCLIAGMEFPGLVAMLQHFVENPIPPQDGVDSEPLVLGEPVSSDAEEREEARKSPPAPTPAPRARRASSEDAGAGADAVPEMSAANRPRMGRGINANRTGSVWGLPS
jgi:hypothetical protein